MKQLETISYVENKWVKGNPKVIGPLSHGSWMGSPVFDGGRCFDGFAPDLNLHCDRIIKSAKAMMMEPNISAEEIYNISISGIKKLGKNKDLYIRPLIWAEDSMGLLRCDPQSAKFCVSIIEMPMDFQHVLLNLQDQQLCPLQLTQRLHVCTLMVLEQCNMHMKKVLTMLF